MPGPNNGIATGPGFPGINVGQSGGGTTAFTPPDDPVAIGPNHIVDFVNVEGEIWTRAGVFVTMYTLQSFWGVSSSESLSDPRVLFDWQSGRWFASILDITTNDVCAAVSSTNDPTGSWTGWCFHQANGYLPDQPILGIDYFDVILSSNDFMGSTFQGAQYWVLSKADMLLLNPLHFFVSTVLPSDFSIHPVDSLSSSSIEYMVESCPTSSCTTITLFTLTGVPPTVPSVSTTTFTIATPHVPPSSPQQGTSTLVDSGDTRIQDAKWSFGLLWASFNDACKPSGDVMTRSCFRLVEINTAGSPAVVNDFDVGSSGLYGYYAALSMDALLDLSVVYGFSSSTNYPSVAVTGLVNTGPSTLQPSVIIKAGSSFENDQRGNCSPSICSRYGDYFGAANDMLDQTQTLVSGEYVDSSVSSVDFCSPGGCNAQWAVFIDTLRVLQSGLTMVASTGGSIFWTIISSCSGSCSGTVDPGSPTVLLISPGSKVTMTATATTGFSFNSFNGDQTGTTNPITLTTAAVSSETAYFTANVALSLSTGSITIPQGGSNSLTAIVTGGAQEVAVTYSAPNPGVTLSFSADPLTASTSGTSTTVTITASPSALAGTFSMTFAALGADGKSSTQVLSVTVSQTLNFETGSGTSHCSGVVCGGSAAKYTIDNSAGVTRAPNCGTTPIASGGLCVGDNSQYVFFQLNLIKSGFTSAGMTSGDQYEVDFTVGPTNVALLFEATGSSTATFAAYYFQTGAPHWSAGETLSGTFTSGTPLFSGSTNTEAGLTDSTGTVDGAVVFAIAKSYLLSPLGGSGNTLTNLIGYAYSGSSGCPGDLAGPPPASCLVYGTFPGGTALAKDYDPSTLTLSYTLQSGPIPEFPDGVLLLFIPILFFYLALRSRRQRLGDTRGLEFQ
ncbi:MAG: hypothetical protein OK452_06985 [Thaumarchaeota archaeon]|nr:hypothetical protein [Nitrososphaerota archaeon]